MQTRISGHHPGRRGVLEQIAGGTGFDRRSTWASSPKVVLTMTLHPGHCAGAADHVDAGAIRQAQVHQQHIGRRPAQHRKPLGAGARHAQHNHVGRALNRRHQGVLKVDIVLDQGDTDQRTL